MKLKTLHESEHLAADVVEEYLEGKLKAGLVVTRARRDEITVTYGEWKGVGETKDPHVIIIVGEEGIVGLNYYNPPGRVAGAEGDQYDYKQVNLHSPDSLGQIVDFVNSSL